MYGGCFLQTKFSKILNVCADPKTRPSIYFKTHRRAFKTLTQNFETLGGDFEGLKENQTLGFPGKTSLESFTWKFSLERFHLKV